MKYSESKTCTRQCRSNQHALELISLLTKTNDVQILLSGLLQCWNCQKIHDSIGRYLLHMAASCGRAEVCDWLVRFKRADLNLKTFENGWTPAHAAAYYGQIDSLITLIKLGASLIKKDYDRLTPLDQLSLDKWEMLRTRYVPDSNDDFEVYCWGSNINFNLGNGHGTKNSNAESIEYFKKTNTSIIDIKMSKFHTVYLAKSGEVYTCGFGIDGRLGHDDETTLVSPKLIEQLKSEKIVKIAASRNNTYFLSSEGNLYSCGTNEFKQLGQQGVAKSLSPRLVNIAKRLKGSRVTQIECSRFHCVLLTSSSQVYTFGLNAGQIGHPNETVATATTNYNNSVCYLSEPRLITTLNEPDIEINLIGASDGCTVAVTKSHLYLFNDYKSKRLNYVKETGSQFKKIRLIGGKLDHSINPSLKWIEDLNKKILIMGLTIENQLYVWSESDPVWRNICWSSGNKTIKVEDFDLNLQGIIFTTQHGSCFKAELAKNQKTIRPVPSASSNLTNTPTQSSDRGVKSSSPTSSSQFHADLKVVTYDIVQQIPFVNRCYRVFCDQKARNFFALQYHPNTAITGYPIELSSEFSSNMTSFYAENVSMRRQTEFSGVPMGMDFYDMEIRYQGSVFQTHRFILFSRCAKLLAKIDAEKRNESPLVVELDLNQKFSLRLVEVMLEFVYKNEFSADSMKQALKAQKVNNEASFIKFLAELKDLVVDKFGFTDLKSSLDQNVYQKSLRELHLNNMREIDRIETMAAFVCRILNNGKRRPLKLSRHSYREFQDCEIECNADQRIACHKCVLIARSEFFRNMLLGTWLESNMFSIRLPFDQDLMQIVIDYLYTDEIQMDFIHTSSNKIGTSSKSKNEREIEILFNLFVLSDQLLLERLKNLCEFKLANLVNLKNIGEIFVFSDEYDAKQLKDFCMEFISLNLTTLIDMKQLESVEVGLLHDLAAFYREWFSFVGSRRITPYSDGPDPDKIDLVSFDLIYNQKYVEGEMGPPENSSTASTKAQSQAKKTPLASLDKQQEELNSESKVNHESPSSQEPNEEIASPVAQLETEEKWVRVKKQNRRKATEIQIEKTPVTPVGAFYTKKDVEKYKEEKIVQSEPVKKIQNDWPDLAEASAKSQVVETSKKVAIKQSSIVPSISKQPVRTFSWGNQASTSQLSDDVQSPPSTNFSLLDVMNEEMRKMNLNQKKPPIRIASKEPTSAPSQPVFKGWKVDYSAAGKAVNGSNTFATIIEMEKKSSEQYNKLKNRPLEVIQLEERAIEELKKVYDVDNMFDMTITVEVSDESSNFSCAPIWKKN